MYIKEKHIKTIDKKVTYIKKVNITSLRNGALRVNKTSKTRNKENN